MSTPLPEESVLDRINDIVRTIDYHLNVLKTLGNAILMPTQREMIDDEFFTAEVKFIPMGDKMINAIFRIAPKKDIEEELLQLVYLSEIFLKEENAILRSVSSGSWKKLAKGKTISFSMLVYEDLKDLEIRRILAKFRRAFSAFNNDNLRKKLLQERKKLESLANNPKKKAKEIILTVMKINDLLFYESP